MPLAHRISQRSGAGDRTSRFAGHCFSFVNQRAYGTRDLQPNHRAAVEEARQAAETDADSSPISARPLATGSYYYACLRWYETAVPLL